MPEYTRHFEKFNKTRKVKDLKEALTHCDDEWTISVVADSLEDGFNQINLSIDDIDVSYSDGLMQIKLKEEVEE